MCIIAAPEGVKKMQECHPDVDMYIGALDEQLNSTAISYRDLAMQETVSSAQNRRCLSLTENVIWRKVWTKEPTIFPGTSIFMGVAHLAALRSKDPNTQVGCCIVSEDNKILSIGYNGFPKGCSDDEFPWRREGDPYDTKYFYTTHSELNAILNYRGGSLEGAKLYVSLFPCNEVCQSDHSVRDPNRSIRLR